VDRIEILEEMYAPAAGSISETVVFCNNFSSAHRTRCFFVKPYEYTLFTKHVLQRETSQYRIH